jgi:hypothetical protein
VQGVHCHGFIESGIIKGKPLHRATVKLNTPCFDLYAVSAMCHLKHRLRRIDANNSSLVGFRSGKL